MHAVLVAVGEFENLCRLKLGMLEKLFGECLSRRKTTQSRVVDEIAEKRRHRRISRSAGRRAVILTRNAHRANCQREYDGRCGKG